MLVSAVDALCVVSDISCKSSSAVGGDGEIVDQGRGGVFPSGLGGKSGSSDARADRIDVFLDGGGDGVEFCFTDGVDEDIVVYDAWEGVFFVDDGGFAKTELIIRLRDGVLFLCEAGDNDDKYGGYGKEDADDEILFFGEIEFFHMIPFYLQMAQP